MDSKKLPIGIQSFAKIREKAVLQASTPQNINNQHRLRLHTFTRILMQKPFTLRG